MNKFNEEELPENLLELANELQCNIQCFNVNEFFAFLIMPEHYNPDSNTPWLWYSITLKGIHPKTLMSYIFEKLLSNGIAVAGIDVGESYGNPKGVAGFSALYEVLVSHYKLSAHRIVLMPQSRGGLMVYNWAARNAEKIMGIAGIYTVCDIRSYPGLETAVAAYEMSIEELEGRLSEYNPIDLLQPLADLKISIFHIHGDNDQVVPLEKNSGELYKRYKALGGNMTLKIVPGGGHSLADDFFRSKELVDFILEILAWSHNTEGF